MKKIILAGLISLIALPAAAAGPATWTGEKRIKEGTKLECHYKFQVGRTKYLPAYTGYTWNTSWDHGDSPVCAKKQYDSGSQWWHMSSDSTKEWKGWRNSEAGDYYNDLRNFEKSNLIKNWSDPVIPFIDSNGTMLAIPTNAYKAYLAKVRIGMAEPLQTFIKNANTYGIYPDIQTSQYAAYKEIAKSTTQYISVPMWGLP